MIEAYQVVVVLPYVAALGLLALPGYRVGAIVNVIASAATFGAGLWLVVGPQSIGDYAIVDEFNIVNFEFSKNFNDAIEAKVTAEQQALAAKNKLEQIKFEADQKIAEARGKAEAMTIESNALKSNPQILELRALEKWNGTLPQVTGGAIPLINLPK